MKHDRGARQVEGETEEVSSIAESSSLTIGGQLADRPEPREGGKLPTKPLGCGNQSAYISLVNRRKVPPPSLRPPVALMKGG